MRIGFFGGSFDPVHLGHLWIAESAIEALGLDQVLWVPAATSPLKQNGPVASSEDRLQMLRLALSGNTNHVIDERELKREGISYTFDTMVELTDQQPDNEFVMIIGSDSLASIRQWHRPAELLELVLPAVVQRGGEPEIDFSVLEGLVAESRVKEIRDSVIHMPVIELSSSQLRERLAAHRSIRYRTPRSVEAYISAQSLYRDQG